MLDKKVFLAYQTVAARTNGKNEEKSEQYLGTVGARSTINAQRTSRGGNVGSNINAVLLQRGNKRAARLRGGVGGLQGEQCDFNILVGNAQSVHSDQVEIGGFVVPLRFDAHLGHEEFFCKKQGKQGMKELKKRENES